MENECIAILPESQWKLDTVIARSQWFTYRYSYEYESNTESPVHCVRSLARARSSYAIAAAIARGLVSVVEGYSSAVCAVCGGGEGDNPCSSS